MGCADGDSADVSDSVGGGDAVAGDSKVLVVCGDAVEAAVPEGAAGEAVGKTGLLDADVVVVPPISDDDGGAELEALPLDESDPMTEALALPLSDSVRRGDADAPPRRLPLALRDGGGEGRVLTEGSGVAAEKPL